MSVYVWGCVRVVCTTSYAEKLYVQDLVHRTFVLAQFPKRQRCHEETEGKSLRTEAFCFRRVREGCGEWIGSQEGPVPPPSGCGCWLSLSVSRLRGGWRLVESLSVDHALFTHLSFCAPAASTGPPRWLLFWAPPPLARAKNTTAAQESSGWFWFHPAPLHRVPT